MSKYAGKQGSFGLQLAEFAEKANAAINASVREVAIEIGNSLIRMSPVDTGRFRANWHASLDFIEPYTFDDLDPSGRETIESLVAAFNDFRPGQQIYIVNNLPYAIPLEYGHSAQAPGGMVRITLARFQQIVDEAIRNNQV